jgi:hypothetical protein
MSFVYAVRCNFMTPPLEDAWHAWYSGPKLAEMMTHPLFLSGQRYRAVGLDRTITYLALWVVESPDAFTTPEYKAAWGFARWTEHVADWSRNLYRGPDEDVSDLLDVRTGERLYLAAFDAVAAADAESRRVDLEAARPDVMWLPVAGLDRSCPAIGVRRLDAAAAARPLPAGLAAGIRETLYEPICDRRRARTSASAR